MKTFSRNLMLLALCLVGLSLLGGCSKLNLVYDPVDIKAGTCDKTVALYKLGDDRGVDYIGKVVRGGQINKEGQTPDKLYYTQDNVSDWISQALYKQLEMAGCNVKYITDPNAGTDADVAIIGNIKQAYFKRTAMTSWKTVMDLDMAIGNADGPYYTSGYYAEDQYQGARADAQKIMTEQLQDMMKKVVPDLIKNMR